MTLSATNGHPPEAPVPDAAVRAQLDRILASAAFANAGRLSRFLRFIVEGTLDGRSDRLKEYAVGVEVFDRAEDYDPRIDSIVRVEARRLRAKLMEYYATIGEADPLLIGLRKGTYVPHFEPRGATPVPDAVVMTAPPHRLRGRTLALAAVGALLVVAAAVGLGTSLTGGAEALPPTSVAVLPFERYSSDEDAALLAPRMTDGVTAALARVDALTVRSRTSALQFSGGRPALREVARVLNARWIVEGGVHLTGDALRLEVRLVDGVNDRKVWVHSLDGVRADIERLEQEMATALAAQVTARGTPQP